MYSGALEKLLKKTKIAVGDRVRIVRGNERWEGLLMPSTSEGSAWVLKLDNGYNVGIGAKKTTIEFIQQGVLPMAAKEPQGSRGEVALLGCGGTIASKVEYTTGAVYPAISPEEIRASFPQLETISTIHTQQLFSILSEDMGAWHWRKMAEACRDEIHAGAKGIVLMHGTDTLGYSAAALSFMLQDLPVPVVFVGAQRSSDRPSSDNAMNLLNAVFTAKQNLAEVAVCMHASTRDDFAYIHRGTRVRKMHTSRRDAFQSINALPLARSDYTKKKFEPLTEFKLRNKRKPKTNTRLNENVALIYIHPGIKPEFMCSLKNYDGIVLAATGLGHVPTNAFGDRYAQGILPEIKSLVDSGIPVVVSPQSLFGRINLNVYTAGRLLKEAGVIGDGCDWLPETVFVKLMWVLGQTRSMKKVRAFMETNIAGEVNPRSPLEFTV